MDFLILRALLRPGLFCLLGHFGLGIPSRGIKGKGLFVMKVEFDILGVGTFSCNSN